MGMFRCKPASRSAERYHSVASCVLKVEGRISNNYFVISVIKKSLACFNAHFTNHLTDFWAILCKAIGNHKSIDKNINGNRLTKDLQNRHLSNNIYNTVFKGYKYYRFEYVQAPFANNDY
jgi:hypothetical protein